MKDVLSLIGRNKELFIEDIDAVGSDLYNKVSTSSFLVIGGAGSIGQAVTKEIFKRNPKKLHVVDISENNLVELVRDIRSSLGYIDGEFATFALDIGSVEYDAFIKSDGEYDYVLNLSALKHVRSEKDPYTLMRMIDTNIFNTVKTIQQSVNSGVKKYFCVSTDKAANPVNMMGASKRIMELFAVRESKDIDISMARFANVAFSDGSLLHGFNQRIQKEQPIVAPNDIRRYFVTPQESGELCLMSCIYGENGDVFFPKLSEDLHLITFADIATKYLKGIGYEPYLCTTEEEARKRILDLPREGKWPCLFTKSDTTGEKDFEEFFTDKETLDMTKFEKLGIIKSELQFDEKSLDVFERVISQMKDNRSWEKAEIVAEFKKLIPDFGHKETGRYLDGKM
ncbi:UDP-N-acetylglucosamine 4,6-dehydratase [Francisella philomiragia]|uniref:UDP-N-acetylglucosamine 4,6-dehydratase n=1 Tax=Francisella philomiragia subsp. philomiragia (strain ATCC 25017 / CCUG 19701 / FSC 153 / O\|nr:UDP-N-acetylglucosamine 4,6-dehydratase [Francisella philomiragia]AJI48219.1 UDP-N-acetylglucosamine 4,6-dehydratase [Francisella philomiragia]AJI49500.1 UDP-N-acetylglucosamine 4,6-dehydratase [Francisella philomiragia]MBK2019698.1 UDP-N-acetylglucosamine 4,6-dehydratase [Francisella philomiragia]MBK2029503.1 UDP-N-acetylglucosamine 4,6-dehydratase [Francisella philomiragia]MBK2264029.1 UDP-N-acetylglucosamine 4,6-dehydratase [Francisella philomiragia]